VKRRTLARIVLIGCGQRKRSERAPARELYTGPLFADRLAYADASRRPFWIVSARHGLIAPGVVLEPYDLTVRDLSPVDAAAWSLGVVRALLDELSDTCDLSRLTVELHMGADYAEPLRQILPAIGINYSWPVRGLSQGEQRAWYAAQRRRAA
jgi:hypothetical protein